MAKYPLNHEARRALERLLVAGGLILEWTKDVKEGELWRDKMLRSAVERQFEVIAEALWRVRIVDLLNYNSLNEAHKAIGLGEVIRRDVYGVDYGVIIRTTRVGLPELLTEVRGLIDKGGTDGLCP